MSEFRNIVTEIIDLGNNIKNEEVQSLIQIINSSNHIFLSGAGRSGLMVKAFANRLLHLGFSVSVVGEVTSPHSQPEDLLIISTASGTTTSLVNQATIAKKNNVKIAVVTTNIESPIAQLADTVLLIPASSKDTKIKTYQPMGSLFEQASLILYDSIVLNLMEILSATNDTMYSHHADLE